MLISTLNESNSVVRTGQDVQVSGFYSVKKTVDCPVIKILNNKIIVCSWNWRKSEFLTVCFFFFSEDVNFLAILGADFFFLLLCIPDCLVSSVLSQNYMIWVCSKGNFLHWMNYSTMVCEVPYNNCYTQLVSNKRIYMWIIK